MNVESANYSNKNPILLIFFLMKRKILNSLVRKPILQQLQSQLLSLKLNEICRYAMPHKLIIISNVSPLTCPSINLVQLRIWRCLLLRVWWQVSTHFSTSEYSHRILVD